MKIPKITRLPSGAYNVRLRLGGESISITASSERECRRKAQQVKADYLAGEKYNRAQGATVGLLADEYIDHRQNVLSPSTVRGYRQTVARYDHLRRIPAQKVEWQREANAAAARYAAKTVRNDFGFFRAALKAGGIALPPLSLPQVVREEHPWLTPEQIPVFLAAIYGEPMEIGALLALHGLRRSELLALDKGAVWGGVIHVMGAVVKGADGTFIKKRENKNATSRRLVDIVIPRLQELVDEAPDGPLYRFSPDSLYPFINRACANAGLPQVGVHGLRHSYASLCCHCGLSMRQCMELGGWASVSVVQRIYTHVSNEDRVSGSGRLRDYFTRVENADENATEELNPLRRKG